MARRRERIVVGDAVDGMWPSGMPAELRTCTAEEWLGPEDVGLTRDEMLVTAWGRWRRARWGWAKEHGVDVRELGPSSAPRFRGDD